MSQERPKIAEKVIFWEEQDKINQALIPRVLEMHDIVINTSNLSQKNSSDYVELKLSISEVSKSVKDINNNLLELNSSISNLSSEHNGTKTKLSKILEEVNKLKNDLSTQKNQLDQVSKNNNSTTQEVNLTNLYLLCALSIIISIIALVF